MIDNYILEVAKLAHQLVDEKGISYIEAIEEAEKYYLNWGNK